MSSRQILNLPKHQNPSPNRTASAPYNFVPLPEVVVTAVDSANDLPDHDRYYADRHTGYFEVTLTTKSPLYVRCPFTLQDYLRQERGEDANAPFRQQVRNTPHFFYTRDRNQPVIPGSSLRGMLRNVLEIVSYGKVQWVTDKKLFFRTVDATALGKYYSSRIMDQSATGQSHDGYRPVVEAGFIRRSGDDWQIEPCQVARVEIEDVATAFGVAVFDSSGKIDRDQSIQNLYTNRGPSGQPRWEITPAGTTTPVQLQHSQVFVITDPTPRDYRHSGGRYLRYCRVNSISRTATGRPGEKQGILVLTGPVPRQHLAFVFIPTRAAAPIAIPNNFREHDINKRLVDLFHDKDQLTKWQTQTFQRGKPGGARRDQDGFLCDGEPIFFLRENGQLTFFGRAQMFRLPYAKCPIDLVHEELRRPEDIDYAEALFGFVRTSKEFEDMKQRVTIQQLPKQGDKRRAYAGRVFVTDAMLVEGQTDYWLSSHPITPKILATPKPTAFQHYLTQQEPDNRNELDHYDSPPPHETTIRGHKRYWHQGLNPSEGLTLDQIREHIEEERSRLTQLATSTQHTQFKPIKPGVQFRFRVYFENLSERELGALCWALHPLGDPAKEYCHHLGMGKPLGMGAVKLEATLCLTDRSRHYASVLEGDNWQTGTSGTAESLSDRATLERRTQDFEQHILDTLKLNTTCQHLFQLKRIAMLLKMMEWPGFRAVPPVHGHPAPNNCVITESGRQRPNTRYMMIELPGVQRSQKNEYRERPVLPDPRAFDPAIDKLAEPLPDNGKPQNDAPREQGSTPLQAKQDQRPTIPQGAVVATVQQVGDKWVDVQIEGHEALIRCTGLNPAGLGLKPGSTIYVELKRDKSTKRVISASFKGMPR